MRTVSIVSRGILAILLLVALVGLPTSAAAAPTAEEARKDIQATFGFVPTFLKALPDHTLPAMWEAWKGVQLNPDTALSGKEKELIGLAVAAQIPCTYCVLAHTEFARLHGATDAELKEAVIVGAMTRHWSTFVNGIQPDMNTFRGEVEKMVAHMAEGKEAPGPIDVVDQRTALRDVEQTFGTVPVFLRDYPAEGTAGAWFLMRDIEMNPQTALTPRLKTLAGIAVAAQVPCSYCVYADTRFAKLEGASEREIREAVALAAVVRLWSTWLNGDRADLATFRRDLARLVKTQRARMEAPKTGK